MNIGETEEYALPPEENMPTQEPPPPAGTFEPGPWDEEEIATELQRQELAEEAEARGESAPEGPAAGTCPEKNRAVEITQMLEPAFLKASQLTVNPEEEMMLRKLFADDTVEIRPNDGLIYIPHMLVRERLIDAFGAGQWTMIRRRVWTRREGDREILMAEWVMIIRGVAVGETVCAHPLNKRMSYGDALESTEGEAVRRIAAKRLGCGSQVWHPTYCQEWTRKFATRIGDKWFKKRSDLKEAKEPAPAYKTVSEAISAPRQAIPAAEEGPQEKRERWLKLLRPLGHHALLYLRSASHLNDNQGLEELPADKVPKTARDAGEILDAIRRQMDSEPLLRVKTEGGREDTISWREAIVPFGKDKGAKFGALPKETLWWWATQWVPKPFVSPKNGKEYPIKDTDIQLRRMLDQIRDLYQFTPARPRS